MGVGGFSSMWGWWNRLGCFQMLKKMKKQSFFFFFKRKIFFSFYNFNSCLIIFIGIILNIIMMIAQNMIRITVIGITIICFYGNFIFICIFIFDIIIHVNNHLLL